MSTQQIKLTVTEEGYQALLDYMAADPQKYRTIAECATDLAGIGLETITGRRVRLTGAGWGGQRPGAGRKPSEK